MEAPKNEAHIVYFPLWLWPKDFSSCVAFSADYIISDYCHYQPVELLFTFAFTNSASSSFLYLKMKRIKIYRTFFLLLFFLWTHTVTVVKKRHGDYWMTWWSRRAYEMIINLIVISDIISVWPELLFHTVCVDRFIGNLKQKKKRTFRS